MLTSSSLSRDASEASSAAGDSMAINPDAAAVSGVVARSAAVRAGSSPAAPDDAFSPDGSARVTGAASRLVSRPLPEVSFGELF
ncbi:hypothetical protein [Streptomyces katsurahamanus]|uniref:hypothetical protein n=1 Tax=Streptomyces katsurahamanus TaxID=2577098 RepID=UPI001E471AE4|nr:hypothetical protein [Streptomyces katsurahamanus]